MLLYISMNSKQKRTLAAIFSAPTPKNLTWSECVSLLKACGCDVVEGDGSRVSFVKDDLVLHLHKPHPQKECKPYMVRQMRGHLEDLGVKP